MGCSFFQNLTQNIYYLVRLTGIPVWKIGHGVQGFKILWPIPLEQYPLQAPIDLNPRTSRLRPEQRKLIELCTPTPSHSFQSALSRCKFSSDSDVIPVVLLVGSDFSCLKAAAVRHQD